MNNRTIFFSLVAFLFLLSACSQESVQPEVTTQQADCNLPLIVTIPDLSLTIHENPVYYSLKEIIQKQTAHSTVITVEGDYSQINQAFALLKTTYNDRMYSALGVGNWFSHNGPNISLDNLNCPKQIEGQLVWQSDLGSGWKMSSNPSLFNHAEKTPRRYIVIESEDKGSIEFALTEDQLKKILKGHYYPRQLEWIDTAQSASIYSETALQQANIVAQQGELVARVTWYTNSLEGQETVLKIAASVMTLVASENYPNALFQATWYSHTDQHIAISTDLQIATTPQDPLGNGLTLKVGRLVTVGQVKPLAEYMHTSVIQPMVQGDIYLLPVAEE